MFEIVVAGAVSANDKIQGHKV